MKKQTLLYSTLGLILFLSASCSAKTPTPDPNLIIRQSVAATIAAMPIAPTVNPPTPYPPPTPVNLAGLFCEYEFCLGHPAGMAFYDHLASLNPLTPSEYKNGFLAAYQIPSLVINFIWVQAPGTSDPQFLLDTVLDDQTDTRTGNMDVKLVRGMNVMFTQISTTISLEIPFGAAGAWTCGDRVFAWKAYTQSAEMAAPLFEDALARFTCGQ